MRYAWILKSDNQVNQIQDYTIVHDGIYFVELGDRTDIVAGIWYYNPTTQEFYIPTPPVTPPSDIRRNIYGNTKELWSEIDQALTPILVYNNENLTVDEANQLWKYYTAEGNTTKSTALSALILTAKTRIRELYPDVV